MLRRVLLSAPLLLFGLSQASAILAIDGTPVTGNSATTTLASAAFTNSNANALIIAVIASTPGTASVPTVSSVSGGCTWTNRKSLSGTTLNYGFSTGNGTILSIWYCVSSTPFSAQVVTATLSANADGNITVFAISGENPTTPWDPNVSLPASQTSATHVQATPTVSGVSTTNSNSVLVAFVGGFFGNAGASFPLTVPTGFTGLSSINNSPTFSGQQTAYDIVAAAQSSVTVTYGSQYTDFYYVVDAVQMASSSSPTKSLTMMGVGQ